MKKVIEASSLWFNNFGKRYESFAKAVGGKNENETKKDNNNEKIKPSKQKDRNYTTKAKPKSKEKQAQTKIKSNYKTNDQIMQAMFDILELNKRIIEGIVEVMESDNETKALVKIKKLFRIIKSKSYKEKQDKIQEIILQSKNRIQQITEAIETNENDRSSKEEISDMSLDNETIDQWISLCKEASEFKYYKELSWIKRKKTNHNRA